MSNQAGAVFRRKGSHALRLSLLSLLIGGAAHGASSATHQFDVPRLELEQALLRIARQAGVEIYLNGASLQGMYGNPVSGQHSLDEALRDLLAGSGIDYRLSGAEGHEVIELSTPGNVRTSTLAIQPLSIYGGFDSRSRDEKGYDAIYSDDLSTVYAGKQQIERYKGAAPADVFKGMLNVYSGDARNSGALDPNVRGIQGPGRVPLTIDGTEQAITVWRGYNGATNRNYIDPNLIGGIKVIKGPNLERNVYSGVGGAVVAKTIDVNDILKDGEDFGGEIKIEGSNGSVKPRVPTLHTGEDYRNIPGFQPGLLGSMGDPTLRVTPKTSRDNGLLSSDDYAYRLALGKRHEQFDVLLAYAYREKGNHFSGKNNAGYYSTPHNSRGTTEAEISPIRGLALGFPPRSEVMNTSSKMESWLGKVTWNISDEQKLSFGVRDTDSLYGEVMPSRIQGGNYYEAASGMIQWPLSHVDAKAYNLEYTWNPSANRWIDFYSNVWFTDTRSDTYTAGGTPNFAFGASDPYIFNTAIRGSDNDRTGATLSNKMKLLDSLDLTLGGSWQYEKLRSDADQTARVDPGASQWNGSWSLPRAGRRQEWEGNFNFNWRPVERLTFTLGARYSSYWAFDDYLSEQQKAGKRATTAELVPGYIIRYRTIDSGVITEHYDIWYHDGKGRYDRANNPCNNISAATVANFEEAYGCQVLNGSIATRATGLQGTYSATPNNARNRGIILDINNRVIQETRTVDGTAETKRSHAWTPAFSATYKITEDSRVYFRYSEAKRYPSMFESTIGFSASQNFYYDIKPEHAHNYELAYVHDLSQLLELPYADFKLSYYHHKTTDVIERDEKWRFSNIEQQTIRGAEMQARFDSGRFFGDLGLAYVFENRVCDEHVAQSQSRLTGRGGAGSAFQPVARCVEGGFIGGYLLTQAIPELSGNLSFGGRFMNNKLEVGSRILYHKQYSNGYLKDWAAFYGNYGVNTPFSWDDLITYDAYVNYRFSDNLGAELVGTNLTNEYYVDPVTRSTVAAPGRILKMSLTANF